MSQNVASSRLTSARRELCHFRKILRPLASQEFSQNRTQTMRRLLVPAFIGAGVWLGSVLGAVATTGPDAFVTFLEAFGAIVFAYFVMEELLREAHQVDEHPWTAAMFFVGFIPLFIVAVAISQ
jgi:ZIP family zinc transporter